MEFFDPFFRGAVWSHVLFVWSGISEMDGEENANRLMVAFVGSSKMGSNFFIA
ncbi:MAG: hypothetical protein ACPGSG_11640 [Prolixibacteraceae bacterium]